MLKINLHFENKNIFHIFVAAVHLQLLLLADAVVVILCRVLLAGWLVDCRWRQVVHTFRRLVIPLRLRLQTKRILFRVPKGGGWGLHSGLYWKIFVEIQVKKY